MTKEPPLTSIFSSKDAEFHLLCLCTCWEHGSGYQTLLWCLVVRMYSSTSDLSHGGKSFSISFHPSDVRKCVVNWLLSLKGGDNDWNETFLRWFCFCSHLIHCHSTSSRFVLVNFTRWWFSNSFVFNAYWHLFRGPGPILLSNQCWWFGARWFGFLRSRKWKGLLLRLGEDRMFF